MPAKPGQRHQVTPEILAALNEALLDHDLDIHAIARSLKMDRSTLQKILRGKTTSTPALPALLRAFGVDPSAPPKSVPKQRVPLVGYVGAGEKYYAEAEAGAWVGFDDVDPIPGEDDVFAVRVKGASMRPVYNDGDLLYFKRNDAVGVDSLVGEDCIVQVLHGPAYVKQLEAGSRPGLYRLVSYGDALPLDDVSVEWAAQILWVKKRPATKRR